MITAPFSLSPANNDSLSVMDDLFNVDPLAWPRMMEAVSGAVEEEEEKSSEETAVSRAAALRPRRSEAVASVSTRAVASNLEMVFNVKHINSFIFLISTIYHSSELSNFPGCHLH